MTTLNLSVSASADDARMDGGPTQNAATTIIDTLHHPGSYNGNPVVHGVRFQNVTVPQGTTITSATFAWTAQATYSTASTLQVIVKGEDVDNAAAFAATNGNLRTANRPRTTATSANWDLKNVTADTAYSISVTSIVQEIVDRAGWASGNALVLLIEDNGSTGSEWQDMYAQDHATGPTPTLEIIYGGGIDLPLLPNTPANVLARM